MSTIEKTEAVVLRSIPFRETSKIVTFYTRRFGRLSTIVRGARRSPGKFGSSLEPMSHDVIVVYKKEGRELQTLSQCDRINSFRRLTEDLDRMSAGMTMIELVWMVTREEEENAQLFSLLTQALTAADDATKNPFSVLYWFEVRLAKHLGFEPFFDRCAGCRKTISTENQTGGVVRFHLGRGGPLCESCPPEGGQILFLSRPVLGVLAALTRAADAEAAGGLSYDAPTRDAVHDFLQKFLRYHVPGLRPLRSEKVFSRILEVQSTPARDAQGS
jgi:DNA repair protein RecO (recombination protein O)